MKIVVLNYSVHPIDIGIDEVSREDIPEDGDLADYVKQLITSDMCEREGRKFEWKSKDAPISALISKLCLDHKNFKSRTYTLAKRLHEKERNAQKKVAHMNVKVQKGSLLQVLFKKNGLRHFLLAKVHLAQFLDETSYKKQSGYPIENTVLKMALIRFNEYSDPSGVSIADSNAQIAEYWWKEFLELTELTTDEYNTKTSLNAMEGLLGRKLKNEHRADYYQLRNNLIGYYRTNKQYNHEKMLTYVFGDYEPVDSRVKIENLRAAASELPEKQNFDMKFGIQSYLVNKRRKTTIALTDQIDLEIKDAINNMRDTIHSATLEDGTKGVFVRSPNGFEYFGSETTNVQTSIMSPQ